MRRGGDWRFFDIGQADCQSVPRDFERLFERDHCLFEAHFSRGGQIMPETILVWDFSKNLTSKATGDIFKKIDNCKVQCQIDDKVAKALKESKDQDLAYLKIQEKMKKLCMKTEEELGKKLQDTKIAVASEGDQAKRQALIDACRKEMTVKLGDLRAKLKVLPEEQWKKFVEKYAKAKAEYKSYKLDAAVELAVGTLEVAGGAASAAASHGASLAFSIVAIVRGVGSISSTVYLIAVDVEKFGKALSADLLALAKEFKEAKTAQAKVLAGAKDVAKTLGNVIAGGAFFNTVGNAEKKAEGMTGKVAGTYVGGVKLSQNVTKCLNEMEALDKELAKASPAQRKPVQEKLEKLQKAFAKLFDNAAETNAKAKRAEELLKTIKKAIKVLDDKACGLAEAEKAIELLASLALAAGAAGAGLSGEAKSGLEIAKESINLVNEVTLAFKKAFGK
jgi:hypothetical protein